MLRVISILLLALLSATPQAALQPIDRIVAVVNDDVITMTELERATELVSRQLRDQGTRPPSDAQLRRRVLDKAILDRIELQLAETAGIRVDDASLNRAMSNLAQRNELNLEQFRQTLERDGFQYAQFREDLRQQLTIGRGREQQVYNRISIGDAEIEQFLDRSDSTESNLEYRLGHILIGLPEAATPQQIGSASNNAWEIVRRLRGGADFAQTAVTESDGQQALDGGDLGWRTAPQLPTLIGNLVRDMQPGQISDPLRSASGFHIIALFGKRGESRRLITQTHARHILIETNAVVSSTEARAQLEVLRERILNGEDFTALARAHSEDGGTASEGGDLGWVSPGLLVERFQEVMDTLTSGEISHPFQTRFGWHIVQVLERREHDASSDFRRREAIAQLRKRKAGEQLELWLRQLRDEAYVEVRLDE